jgi:PAS domain S-box-containing protein
VELALDHVPAILWTTDTQLRLTSLRGAALRSVGLVADAALGHGLDGILADESERNRAVEAHEKALGGTSAGFELASEGRLFDARVEPLEGSQGGVVGVVGFAVDVTEARRLDDQLRAAQRMEGIGRLAGGIAHDFNNIVTVILTYSQFLEDCFEADDPARADVAALAGAARRAGTLTAQLLAFSRRQVLQPKVLDLNGIIKDMVDMLRRMIGEDIELVLELDPGKSNVKADPVQLEQVLLNLVVNARDAMPRGGRLTISTRSETVDPGAAETLGVSKGRYVVASIGDTGEGMSEETQAHIFEPFFTTKEAGRGTGLGLSTVYGIVKQSDGSIHVESAPEKGTTFTIRLPEIEQAPVARKPDGARAETDGGGETILLVEDDPAVRLAAYRTLERHGYQVIVAGNGVEALKVARQHEGEISLVLTDIVMPTMGGKDLLAHLAEIRPEMRRIYMSGYTGEKIEPHGPGDGLTDLLPKPFTPTQLAAKVREVLDRDRGSLEGGGSK